MNAHPGDRGAVLHRDRHARERARVAGLDGVGGGQRALGVDRDEGVELGLGASIRSSDASTSSRAVISPSRTIRASSAAGLNG